MPNHCENVMSVCGSPEDVAAFVEKVKGVGPNYASPGTPFDKLPKGERQDPKDLPVSILSFHQTVPIPEEIQVQGYDPAGYNAQSGLWGTKWGAYDVSLIKYEGGLVKYAFTTAWCPPQMWLINTSKVFPDLTFYLSYSEESPSRGKLSIRDEEILEEIHDSYPFNGDYPKYDEALAASDPDYDDRHYDAANRIQGAYIIGHDIWVGEQEYGTT